MKQKTIYRKGDVLFHHESKAKITFGGWSADGKAMCLSAKKEFLTLDRTDLETNYTRYKDLEKQSRERRRGQGW